MPALVAFLLVCAAPAASGAEGGPRADPKLERCRFLHARVEHYTRLRRGGGSSVRMERWRQARKRYEKEFRDLRCYRYGRRLRPDR